MYDRHDLNFSEILLDNQIKEDEMGMASGMHGRERSSELVKFE
jgi:hypothetical protein